MRTLQDQFNRLLEMPSSYSRFTTALYDAMYTRGSFIAHFNREGFFKARFWTLRDFDRTLAMMREVPELKALIDGTPADLISNARFKIAQVEYATLMKQAEVLKYHAEQLKNQFTKEF